MFVGFICIILLAVFSPAWGQQSDPVNYMPLAIGNQYQYYDGVNYREWSIEKDTLYPNGKRYYYTYFFDNPDIPLRVDSSGNIWSAGKPVYGDPKNNNTQDEYLLFKADAKEGETWLQAFAIADSIYSQCYFNGQADVFGIWRNAKAFIIYPVRVAVSVAQGVGVTRVKYDDGSETHLTYAKVHGVEYGKSVVSVNEAGTAPSGFDISQNYPNPFNGATVIRLDLPSHIQSSSCEFKVYNMLGKLVYSDLIPVKNNTIYRFDTRGLGLTSGTYLYRVEADGYSASKKLILLK